MATQNPIEQEGTYPLPEAQLDRFLMHARVDYPDFGTEKSTLHLNREEAKAPAAELPHRASERSVLAARRAILDLFMAPDVEDYLGSPPAPLRGPTSSCSARSGSGRCGCWWTSARRCVLAPGSPSSR